MTECKQIRTSKVWESFTKIKTNNAVLQYIQGGTCFSREHNMLVGALKEETSRQKRSR